MTIRLTCVLAVSACAAAPHPTPPPTTVYELAQFDTASCVMGCSIHMPMTQSRTWGTLELRGDAATLVIQSDSITPVVICPSIGPGDPFTPCVKEDDPRARPRPRHAEMQLRGRMTRDGSRLVVAVANGASRIELTCHDSGASLDCAATSPDHGLAHLPERVTLELPPPAVNAPAIAST